MQMLWRICFPLDDSNFFFFHLFDKKNALCAYSGNDLVGMLHFLPQTYISPYGESLKGRYFYALATSPSYRNRGIAKKLISRAIELMWKRDEAIAVLVPGDDSLREFYEALSFKPVINRITPNNIDLSKMTIATEHDILRLSTFYKYHMRGRVHAARDNTYWRKLLSECHHFGGRILVSGNRYVVLDESGNIREACPQVTGTVRPYASVRIINPGTVRSWACVSATYDDIPLAERVFSDMHLLCWE